MPQSKPMKWFILFMFMQKIIFIMILSLALPMVLTKMYINYKNKKKLKKW